MKLRSVAISAALMVASTVELAAPASAQTRGGITLSFGTGGYSSYDDDDDQYYLSGGYYAYSVPQYPSYYNYYRQPGFASQVWARRQQLERWRQEEQRRLYWQHERREHQQWRDDDDDDD